VCAPTSAANARSSAARSPGAVARQETCAAAARSMAASVSPAEVDGTVRTGCSVAGLITV
jgi:hypothetical protein